MGGHVVIDTILEFDISEVSIRKIGNMREHKAWHAVSVVKYSAFSKWCH